MEGSSDVKVQSGVYAVEVGRGKRVVLWILAALVAVGLSLVYTALQFRGLERAEAMDMAQLARNIARGEGFTTYVIRPLSLWQMKEHSPTHETRIEQHPDIYNPPLYPLVLAGIFKALPASLFEMSSADRVFSPERWVILPLNQIFLLLSLIVIYLWSKALFDTRVAVTAGLLLLFSDTLWSYSIAGLPTNLLMLLVLLTVGSLWLVDRRLNPPASGEEPASLRRPDAAAIALLIISAAMAGLCFLTRYTAGLLVIPLLFYVWRILRGRGAAGWALLYGVIFLAVITPWLIRNELVSGSLLGIAKYQLFGGEILQRTYQPAPEALFSFKAVVRELVTGTRAHFVGSLRELSSDFLICFFLVGVMYAFRRRDIARLRGVVLGLLGTGILAMALFGVSLRPGFEPNGGDLLVLFLPLVAVFGVAFFYLLLDRLNFPNILMKGAAIGLFALVNVAPLLYTMLPPRRGMFPYPPYIAPYTALIGKWFGPEEIGASDLPWAMAWVGDRRTVWLPLEIKNFEDIHYFVAPKGGISFMLLTPYMLDRKFQSELVKGEFKEWSSIVRERLPASFPLKAVTMFPPSNEQILFADRPRWTEKGAALPVEPEDEKPATKKGAQQPAAAK